MSETIKSWERDLHDESLNGITWHTEQRRATKRNKPNKVKLIGTIAVTVYLIAALMYNYTFTFCTGAFIPDDVPTIQTCYEYQNILPDGHRYVSEDYSIIKVFNRIH